MSVGLGSGTPWAALQAGASGRGSALLVAKASHVLNREGTAGQGLLLELKCVKSKDALLHLHLGHSSSGGGYRGWKRDH